MTRLRIYLTKTALTIQNFQSLHNMDSKTTREQPITKAQRQLMKEQKHVKEVREHFQHAKSPSEKLLRERHPKLLMSILMPLATRFSKETRIPFPREARRRKLCLLYWLDQNIAEFRKFMTESAASDGAEPPTSGAAGSFLQLEDFDGCGSSPFCSEEWWSFYELTC